MHKYTNLRFIYKGKQYNYEVKFKREIYNNVDLYYCNNIKDVKAIKVFGNKILLLINDTYNKNDLDIKITFNLLRVSGIRIDSIILLLYTWYGTDNTSKLITELGMLSEDKKREYIKQLEYNLIHKVNYNIPEKDYFIQQMIGDG